MRKKSRAERRIGKGRTFQQRLDDEMQDFGLIYHQIARSLVETTPDDDVIVPGDWERAFDVEFESFRRGAKAGEVDSSSGVSRPSGTRGKTASGGNRKALQQRFPRPTEITPRAIRAVIQHYELYDFRPRRSLSLGKVPKEIRPAEGLIRGEPPEGAWHHVDTSDPIFWRTLLEIFCRTLAVEEGAPEFWNKRRYFELACDAVMLRDELPRWSKAEAARYLARHKSLREKYVEPRADSARIERNEPRGSAGIARRLSELEEWIGSLDVKGLGRLRQKDQALFDDVFGRRLGLTWL